MIFFTRHSQRGEGKIAMMLVIIGGAILTVFFQIALQFMQTARINATIQEIQAYKTAVGNFAQTYGGFPGDLRDPENKITGCRDAKTKELLCHGGDGNGIVGEIWANVLHEGQAEKNWPKSETVEFWRELAAAGMIDGIDLKAPLFPAAFGKTHPLSRIGEGGYELVYSSGNGPLPQGHYLRLQKSLLGSPLRASQKNAISVDDATKIDRKLDDGNPARGYIIAAGPGCPVPDDKNPSAPKSNGSASDCILLVKIF